MSLNATAPVLANSEFSNRELPPDNDVLAEVLESISLKGALCGKPSYQAPWSARVEAGPPRFYVVAQGRCRLTLESGESVDLKAGDLLFLTHGEAHSLRDCEDATLLGLARNGDSGRLAASGVSTSIVCGTVSFDRGTQMPLLAALPSLMHLPGEGNRLPMWLEGTLRFMISESSANQPGGQAIVNRLVHILLTRAVRNCMSTLPHACGNWLRAAVDPEIGPALGLIHRQPESPWTVASLAEEVGMSRSVFAARFAATVGVPPLHYIVQCRMRAASEMLRSGNMAVKEIAGQVGYRSQAAFRTAFKRWAGTAPGEFRRVPALS